MTPQKPLIHADCLNHKVGECSGTVEYRYPLSGTGKPFPRCDHHWDLRLKAQEDINRKYGGGAPPRDFDPTYAGERWEEED